MNPSASILPLLALLALVLPPTAGHALPSDRKQAIELEADSADIDDKLGVSTYSGHVEITQGSLRIRADKLVVRRHKKRGARLVATGSPVRFRQLPARGKPPITGQARRAEYDTDSELLILSGDAVLKQGKDTFRNDRIVYDRVKGVVKAGKVASGKTRVHIRIEPDHAK